MLIQILNNGPELANTNYWTSQAAHAGFMYLSGNAGAMRLLVPPTAEYLLDEMRTGQYATIEPSLTHPGQCWDVVFHDGSSEPFAVAIDKRQMDRSITPGDFRLTVWTVNGKVLDLACKAKL